MQRADAVFFSSLLIGLLTLSRTAFIETHWDEDAGIATGWLLAKGWKLYSDVFSHHMPLDYIPSWAAACVFGPAPSVCRGLMIAIWLGVCVALWRLSKNAVVPALFALLSSQWLTYWMGQMLLVENLWAYFVVVLLALEECEATIVRAAVAGALSGALLSSSLTCGPAFFLFAIAFYRKASWRKLYRFLASACGGCLAFLLAWSWRHADLSLWYADAVRFNAWSYAYFSGLTPGAPVMELFHQALARNLAYFASFLHWDNLEQFFEGILRLACLGWIAWQAAQRRRLDALWWAFLILALRLRLEHFRYTPPFHSAPFFLAATWLLSRELFAVWEGLRERSRNFAWAWAAACALLLAATLVPTSLATASLSAHKLQNPDSALVDAIKKGTDPTDRLAVFPIYPKLYLETERLPATPGVFYLPWQAAWPPEHLRTVSTLQARKPKIVVVYDSKIWGIPWVQYAADIELWLRGDYSLVPMGDAAIVKVWVRNDYLEEFNWRLKPSQNR